MTSRLSDTRPVGGRDAAPDPARNDRPLHLDLTSETVVGRSLPRPMKIVVAGGFGAGKSTFVSSVSEIAPLTTDATVGPSAERPGKAGGGAALPATVAVHVGRITLADATRLYLFDAPARARFSPVWDELSTGAVGAVVVVDTQRLPDCFWAVDHVERVGLPYVVGLNRFDGVVGHELTAVRDALDVDADVPVVPMDARDPSSARDVLVRLVDHARSHERRGG